MKPPFLIAIDQPGGQTLSVFKSLEFLNGSDSYN